MRLLVDYVRLPENKSVILVLSTPKCSESHVPSIPDTERDM